MDKNTIIVTFATPSHYRFQEQFTELYGNSIDIVNYNSEWLERTSFYRENQQMFQYKKYFGYFLWKPFIIKETLNAFPADNVIYCDTNIRFKDLNGLLKIVNQGLNQEGIFLVKHQPHINRQWTKRDAFVYMYADESRYWNAHQVWTILLGFNIDKLGILIEYLEYCKDPRIVTELPNQCGLPNLEGFREHRWEQSVLSILAEKYKINGPWDLDMFKYYDKVYDEELMKLKAEINKDPLAVRKK